MPKKLAKESTKCVKYEDRKVKPKQSRSKKIKSSSKITGKDMVEYIRRNQDRDAQSSAENGPTKIQECTPNLADEILHPVMNTEDSNSGLTLENTNLKQAQGDNSNHENSESLGSKRAQGNETQGIKISTQTMKVKSKGKAGHANTYKPDSPRTQTQYSKRAQTSTRPEEGIASKELKNKPG